MTKNRLSATLAAALNVQMQHEAHASQIYLSYAAWADSKGYSGISNFLFRHANEERNHMMKVLEYILKRGGEVLITAIPAAPKNPSSLNNCFEKVYEHEVNTTNMVYKLVNMSHDEGDWATWNFMQWFVNEQTEEETLALSLLDKMKIAGGEKMSSSALYSFDRDIEKTPDEAQPAEEVTTENP